MEKRYVNVNFTDIIQAYKSKGWSPVGSIVHERNIKHLVMTREGEIIVLSYNCHYRICVVAAD